MPKVLYEKRNRIAYVTINRPEAMNPIDLETHELLWETWRDFRDDDGVDVAILTGAGDEAFCAGADLKTFVPSWIEQADATFPRKDRLSLSQIAEGRMNGVSCRGLTKSFPGVRALHRRRPRRSTGPGGGAAGARTVRANRRSPGSCRASTRRTPDR